MTIISQYADLIDSEGEPISDEEYSKIKNQLQELEASLNSENLSLSAKNFIITHINILREAIYFYNIDGNEAFREGISKVVTSMVVDQSIIEQNQENGDFQKALSFIGGTWQEIRNHSNDIQLFLAGVQGAIYLRDGVSTIARLLTGS